MKPVSPRLKLAHRTLRRYQEHPRSECTYHWFEGLLAEFDGLFAENEHLRDEIHRLEIGRRQMLVGR